MVPNCLWCGSEFASYTARTGKVKVFCQRKCLNAFNLAAYRIGRDTLHKMASSVDIPLQDAKFPCVPTEIPPSSSPTT